MTGVGEGSGGEYTGRWASVGGTSNRGEVESEVDEGANKLMGRYGELLMEMKPERSRVS